MAYYVKFVPYNQNTLSCIINKTIKFSTVYEFNDFNEMHYIAMRGFMKEVHCRYPEYFPKIKEKIQDGQFRSELLVGAKKRGNYTQETLGKLEKFMSDPNTVPFEDVESIVVEHLVFSSIGIFCIADLSVFEDDSAQLMFAHYGENLTGLALIYEISSLDEKSVPLRPIKYRLLCNECLSGGAGCTRNSKPSRPGIVTHACEWMNGIFKECQDFSVFLNKSTNWSYEKEKRFFAKPGPQQADAHGISLKAILHTPRLQGNPQLETLKNINASIYADELRIQCIYPSSGKYHFIIGSPEVTKVRDWIRREVAQD